MHPLAIGFRGAFFGAVGLMLLGAAAAFAQVHRRVAAFAALAAHIGIFRCVTCRARPGPFPGRVAWHDQASGRTTEVPDLDTA